MMWWEERGNVSPTSRLLFCCLLFMFPTPCQMRKGKVRPGVKVVNNISHTVGATTLKYKLFPGDIDVVKYVS